MFKKRRENNIYYSSIDLLENSPTNLTLATNLEKIIIGEKTNLGSSDINKTKNIIMTENKDICQNFFNVWIPTHFLSSRK